MRNWSRSLEATDLPALRAMVMGGLCTEIYRFRDIWIRLLSSFD
jgi:hypothetical protein